jgi:hypothetical protein
MMILLFTRQYRVPSLSRAMKTVVHQITAQGGRVHMEAAQDGVDFLLGVVRVERERVHDEIQDDEQFVSHRGDLLERAIRVEEAFNTLRASSGFPS